MIKAVLFDMDATLLDINLTAFMGAYVADVSRILARISGKPTLAFGGAWARGYLAIANEGRTDGLTNLELFSATVERLTGVPVADPAIADAISCYERTVLPRRRGGLVGARPMEGGIAAIEPGREMGLAVALATNPSFSEDCIHARMAGPASPTCRSRA